MKKLVNTFKAWRKGEEITLADFVVPVGVVFVVVAFAAFLFVKWVING